jgi:hypothetical protein
MVISGEQAKFLKQAIEEYDYPKVLFDFQANTEITYPSMRELESEIKSDLMSGSPNRVRDGLSNILYWGHRTSGYYWRRVNNFRTKVTASQLHQAAYELPRLKGAGLLKLKEIGLPEFTNISFLSKVRMFIDPANWVVLDRNLLRTYRVIPDYSTTSSDIPHISPALSPMRNSTADGLLYAGGRSLFTSPIGHIWPWTLNEAYFNWSREKRFSGPPKS